MRDLHSTIVECLLLIFGLLLVAACGSPTVPTSTTPFAPDPRTLVRVTGKVTDERGIGIAGAALIVCTRPGRTVSAVTDAAGSYDFTDPRSSFGFGLCTERDGHEGNFQWVRSAAAEVVQDFRLRDVVRIPAGEGLTLVVDSHDTLYGSAEQFRARRVRVVAQGTGDLVVEGSSSSARRQALLSANALEDYPCCPARLDRAVSTGQEVSIYVLTEWTDVPAEFSLTTRLEPR
jgi:hypothetical protein